MAALTTLGWRERVALPDLGIAGLKAKLDTGARSSALHVDALEAFRRDGAQWLRFEVSSGRRRLRSWAAEAPVVDRRVVTDTGGHRCERWFIRSTVSLAGEAFPIDISLTDRRHMLFPMLLGRTAIAGRFVIDPRLSYTQPRVSRAVTDTP
ncbi:MAG: RimK/LysX family protein [Xanthomonadaceae bacterium]|nr:RimK/LysX family protein [Xanthomonadaceae bacterium]MDE1962540.1 ATP-dependent zinc protease [Xanthomonadaceae bacterium]